MSTASTASSIAHIAIREPAVRTPGGKSGGKAANPKAVQRTAAPLIQRLISGNDFDSNTSFWFATGKSDAFFKNVANELRAYEGMPQTRYNEHSPEHVKQKANDEWKARKDASAQNVPHGR